ncbi:MAG: YggS family pyridoxal phosphate-dependent enzyme [Planctomycetaceae bacterium]|nr:YggS family pyridoxal phosphate-dependent enzyme [Planctomycetales bacterium]MCB9923888.1 YggS family pyridoxal phosphate-dependent enzyme [Planctomycetaceae bacterium]
MAALHLRIADNLAKVRQQIADAAQRSGRELAEVTLVAVTKYVDAEVARALLDAGCRDLGESRPQELWRKADALADAAPRWHFIGHLQRNKVRRTVPHISLLHACDSRRLLDELESVAGETDTEVRALIEVNISGDTSKHGFQPSEMPEVVRSLPGYRRVHVYGLMGMASLTGTLDDARRDFERLRLLRDQLLDMAPEKIELNELSMGMSNDFEVAIEEGATMVRVGSALFEGLDV